MYDASRHTLAAPSHRCPDVDVAGTWPTSHPRSGTSSSVFCHLVTDGEEVTEQRPSSCLNYLSQLTDKVPRVEDDYFVCLLCDDDETPDPRSRRRDKDLCVRCNRRQRQAEQYCLSLGKFNAILRAQQWACALCQIEPDYDFDVFGYEHPGAPTFWHIDHDHACCDKPSSCGDCVRGILCRECNAVRLPAYERLPAILRDSPRFNNYLTNPPAQSPEAVERDTDSEWAPGPIHSIMDAFFGQ